MRMLIASALVALATAASAADLTIDVTRNGFSGPIDLAIAPRVEGKAPQWSATKTLTAGKSRATFTAVAPGLYIVLASGPEPLQRLSAKVNVGTNDSALKLTLPKSRTSLRVMRAGQPIANASIDLTRDELYWSTKIATDTGGRFRGALWEPGLYGVDVREGTSAPHVVDVMLSTHALTIDVPDRSVSGRVIGDDGHPIANAQVILKSQNEEATLSVRAITAADGSFTFIGVREGTQTLSARGASYLNSDAATFDLHGASAHPTFTLTMTRGAIRATRVVDRRGDAIAGATLFTACDGQIKSTTITDNEGKAEVSVPIGDACAIYALPKEGSLAMQVVTQNDPLVLRVPDGSSSLRLTLLTEKGEAFPDLWLLMRIDGNAVPPAIARQLARRGFSLVTNGEGSISLAHVPPGTYEFWPYRTDAEGQRLFDVAADFAAPISVNVLTGENSATVRFKSRR